MRRASSRRRRRFRRCPTTADEAVRIALANNPDLVAISRQAIAAGYDVNVARAGRLPTLSAVGSGTYVNELGGTDRRLPEHRQPDHGRPAARIPIFQGGLPAARIRQAQALAGPGAGAGRRHRARGGSGRARRLRRLRRGAEGDPGRDGRGPGQRAGARGQSRRTERRHPHHPRSPERRAGTAELAGRCW